MIPNQFNKIFAEKMLTMTVYQLECEIRACEFQIRSYVKKWDEHRWDNDGVYVFSVKTRKAMVKCMPMWAERLMLIDNYLPMAELMES